MSDVELVKIALKFCFANYFVGMVLAKLAPMDDGPPPAVALGTELAFKMSLARNLRPSCPTNQPPLCRYSSLSPRGECLLKTAAAVSLSITSREFAPVTVLGALPLLAEYSAEL